MVRHAEAGKVAQPRDSIGDSAEVLARAECERLEAREGESAGRDGAELGVAHLQLPQIGHVGGQSLEQILRADVGEKHAGAADC